MYNVPLKLVCFVYCLFIWLRYILGICLNGTTFKFHNTRPVCVRPFRVTNVFYLSENNGYLKVAAPFVRKIRKERGPLLSEFYGFWNTVKKNLSRLIKLTQRGKLNMMLIFIFQWKLLAMVEQRFCLLSCFRGVSARLPGAKQRFLLM